ncbi:MAG: hypothetical protein ABGY96_24910 [bacterium]|nr:hypothetical protein [Gammaproteobacteria bacterium]HIL94608.1 hypothetical protein [Pseudomonadales bacterium]
MNTWKILALVSLLVWTNFSFAETTCFEVEFSDDLHERFPKIDEACLRVLDFNGERYANLEGKIVRASSRTISLRWKRTDGTYISDVFKTKPLPRDFAIRISGKEVRPSALERGQVINTYIKLGGAAATLMAAPDVTLEVALDNMIDAVIDFDSSTEMLPSTASIVPLLGLLGVLLIGAAVSIRLYLSKLRSL